MSMKFRLAVDDGFDTPVPWNARLRVPYQHPPGTVSATDDSFGNEVNVNTIIARFARTGELPPARREAQYMDVTELQGDLTELHNKSQDTISTARQNVVKRREEEAAQKAEASKTASKAPSSDVPPTPDLTPPTPPKTLPASS